MNPPDDLSAFLGVFLDEAVEQIQLLEDGILRLETSMTDEQLHEVFRAAHTLKGSSRAMGFDGIGDLTHAMEDLFDHLRSGRLTVSAGLAEVLFSAVDQLKSAIDEIAQTGSSKADFTQRTAGLRLLASKADSHASTDNKAPLLVPLSPEPFSNQEDVSASMGSAIEDALRSGLNVFDVVVCLARDCALRSVRALLVLQAVEQIGSVLQTVPGRDKLENEEFDFTFAFAVATRDDAESLIAIVRSVSEVVDVTVAEAAAAESASCGLIPADPAHVTLDEPEVPQLVPDAKEGVPVLYSSTRGAAATPRAQTVRVDVARLDSLLNLVGELVIDSTRLAQISTKLHSQVRQDGTADQLRETTAHIGRITSEMQQEIMKARMQPLDNLFARYPRMVRDLAGSLGKEIEFTVEGRDTELDRSVMEVIGDPLIHLLRNCIDHGIEPPDARLAAGKSGVGHLFLRARHEESQIVIEIEDDGSGIDPDRIRAKAVALDLINPEAAARMTDKEAVSLIFSPGFTTVDAVTDVSGRGVGMDIVRSNLTRFGGHIEVDSRIGVGTRFAIKLPLTLAIIRGLLVKACGGTYVLPLASVVEAMEVDRRSIHRINHRDAVVCRGEILPLIDLNDHFGFTEKQEKSKSTLHDSEQSSDHIVVVGAGADRVGVVVDSLLGEQEIVIKSLGNHVGEARGISGATILGDGCIALIVDVNGLLSINYNCAGQKVEAYAA